METTTTVVRLLLGLILVIFPANALFIKAFSPKMPPAAQRLMDAFRESGYLLTFIQGTELVIGLLLLSGYYTPLVLLALLPISVNILLFHLFLAPPVVGPGLAIFAMNVFLMWMYRSDYTALLSQA